MITMNKIINLYNLKLYDMICIKTIHNEISWNKSKRKEK